MNSLLKFSLVALILGSGCVALGRSFPYRVVAVNLSDVKITETRIFDGTGKYDYGCGNLISFGYAANAGPMETAANDIFTVRWKDEQKVLHEQKFDLREKVKRSFKGEIVFVFGADKKFSVEICAEQRQYPIPQRPKP